jgi:hypothetical protein
MDEFPEIRAPCTTETAMCARALPALADRLVESLYHDEKWWRFLPAHLT